MLYHFEFIQKLGRFVICNPTKYWKISFQHNTRYKQLIITTTISWYKVLTDFVIDNSRSRNFAKCHLTSPNKTEMYFLEDAIISKGYYVTFWLLEKLICDVVLGKIHIWFRNYLTDKWNNSYLISHNLQEVQNIKLSITDLLDSIS